MRANFPLEPRGAAVMAEVTAVGHVGLYYVGGLAWPVVP